MTKTVERNVLLISSQTYVLCNHATAKCREKRKIARISSHCPSCVPKKTRTRQVGSPRGRRAPFYVANTIYFTGYTLTKSYHSATTISEWGVHPFVIDLFGSIVRPCTVERNAITFAIGRETKAGGVVACPSHAANIYLRLHSTGASTFCPCTMLGTPPLFFASFRNISTFCFLSQYESHSPSGSST